jgi:hypothetical protein
MTKNTIVKDIITSDLTLIAILAELESCRLNGIGKHKIELYRDGFEYVVSKVEDEYHAEIMSKKTGDDARCDRYVFPIGFEAQIIK